MSSYEFDPDVIGDRYMYAIGGLLWLDAERQRLFNTYGRFTKEKMLELFPNRTWSALKSMAYLLKIPRPGTRFTEEEDHLLVSLVLEEWTYAKIAEVFKYRTEKSLLNRFYRLNKKY